MKRRSGGCHCSTAEIDPHAGQPALDYLRAALEGGAHAISANKGPVVHGYRELERLALRAGRRYRFESAVMDGAPVFSLVRECLPPELVREPVRQYHPLRPRIVVSGSLFREEIPQEAGEVEV